MKRFALAAFAALLIATPAIAGTPGYQLCDANGNCATVTGNKLDINGSFVGGSTSAKQDTGNTSLSNIDTKVGEVQASPTSNTVLDRLKSLKTSTDALGTKLDSLLTQLQTATPAGANNIGNVGGKTVSICVTPTVTATNAYGTNYVVGGKLTFANVFTATGSGILQSVVVTIKKVETSGFTFFPFNSDPSNSTWTDAAVAAINAADVAAVREPISLNANSQLGTLTVASATGLGQAMAPGITSLYGILVANAALTNQFAATSDLQVCVKVLQDL